MSDVTRRRALGLLGCVLAATLVSAPGGAQEEKDPLRQGLELHDQERFAEAIPHFRRALELDPTDVEAQSSLALCLAACGRAEEALPLCDRFLPHGQHEPELLVIAAAVRLQAGRTDHALADVETALDRGAPTARAQRTKAEIHYARLEFRRAVRAARSALEAEPGHAETLTLLGRCLAGQRRAGEAIAALSKAIRLRPDDADAYSWRGYAKTLTGDAEGALADCERAVALEPNHASHLGRRGLAYGRAERLDEAIADLDRAVELAPSDHQLAAWRGWVLLELERYEDALAAYERAIEQKPSWGGLHGYRGHALEALGRTEEARASWDEALDRLRPGHPFVAVIHEWKARAAASPSPATSPSPAATPRQPVSLLDVLAGRGPAHVRAYVIGGLVVVGLVVVRLGAMLLWRRRSS